MSAAMLPQVPQLWSMVVYLNCVEARRAQSTHTIVVGLALSGMLHTARAHRCWMELNCGPVSLKTAVPQRAAAEPAKSQACACEPFACAATPG
eukprot:6460844-Amphidinium_carterae.1